MWLQAAIRTTEAAPQLEADLVSFFGPTGQLWAVGLIFLRVAAIIMLLPGIGNQEVPPRVRIGFGLILALLLYPGVQTTLPPLPENIGGMASAVIHEVMIGLMLGGLIRMILFAMVVAGEIISHQITLAFAQTANPAQAQPSTSLGTFLGLIGLSMVYATGTHHLFIQAISDSYLLFSPLKPVSMGDVYLVAVDSVRQVFLIAMQLSAPILVFGIVYHVAVGFIGRIMPTFPIFFAATPVAMLLGMSMVALGVGTIGMVFIDHYRDFMNLFLRS